MAQHRIRVLIVDDSPDDAELIQRALKRGGFAPECVRVDTPAGIDAVLDGEQRWDMIACDVRMPLLDAAYVVAHAHAKVPRVPIVFVAGAYPQHLWHELGSGLVKRFVSKDRLADLPSAVRALFQGVPQRGRRDSACVRGEEEADDHAHDPHH